MSTEHDSLSFRGMLPDRARGRPYIFVIMGYSKRRRVYEVMAQASDELGLVCKLAGDVQSAGHDLLAKIHFLIEHADLVVAEISEELPNVYYEIGFARGCGKTPLLVVEQNTDIPSDLRGLERLEYRPLDSADDDKVFQKDFLRQVTSRLAAHDTALLRDMLEGPKPRPSFVVVTPKPVVDQHRPPGQIFRRRTYGDELGILGLVSVFGSLWGDDRGLELISGRHAPPELLEEDLNLYLVGSPKSTPQTGELLLMIQADVGRKWSFERDSNVGGNESDPPWILLRDGDPLVGQTHGRYRGPHGGPVWTEDWGIIVRSPHPTRPDRVVMIMAGAHSLGTGAACLAATRSVFVRRIRDLIGPSVLADKRAKFWALVKATANKEDCLLDDSGVTVREAEEFA